MTEDTRLTTAEIEETIRVVLEGLENDYCDIFVCDCGQNHLIMRIRTSGNYKVIPEEVHDQLLLRGIIEPAGTIH